jgi:Ni/Co efflux regulator RcnB
MKPLVYAALAGCAVVLASSPAIADPKHCPPGLAMQGRCGDDFRDRDRDRDRDGDWYEGRDYRDRDRLDDAYEQGYRQGARDAWRAGQRLPDDIDVMVIRNYDQYGLRPPQPGYYYGQVDGEVLLIQAASRMIAQALGSY